MPCFEDVVMSTKPTLYETLDEQNSGKTRRRCLVLRKCVSKRKVYRAALRTHCLQVLVNSLLDVVYRLDVSAPRHLSRGRDEASNHYIYSLHHK